MKASDWFPNSFFGGSRFLSNLQEDTSWDAQNKHQNIPLICNIQMNKFMNVWRSMSYWTIFNVVIRRVHIFCQSATAIDVSPESAKASHPVTLYRQQVNLSCLFAKTSQCRVRSKATAITIYRIWYDQIGFDLGSPDSKADASTVRSRMW